MYLACWTRPDIAYAVSVLAQYFDCADERHFTAAKRVLRYLSGNRRLGITFGGGSAELIGFSDADWGGDEVTRRSRSGVVFMMNKGPVSWTSQKQSTVSTSTCQSEFMAAFEAAKQAVWLRRLMHDFGLGEKKPTMINIDNQGCNCIIKNPDSSHKRSKHWDVQYRYTQELYQNGTITVQYVPTDKQYADMFTKALSRDRFAAGLKQINMIG